MIFLQNYLITCKVVKIIVQQVMTFSSPILGYGMFHQCLRKLGHTYILTLCMLAATYVVG